MRAYWKVLLGSICIMGGFLGCEKDDICVDGDTPRLVIRFYDKDDTTKTKEVTGLAVRGLVAPGDTLPRLSGVGTLDSINIPLNTATNSAQFLLGQLPSGETDTLYNLVQFDYTRKEVFISRACGHVVNYETLLATLTPDADNWIDEITVTETTVSNSDQAHVKIFH